MDQVKAIRLGEVKCITSDGVKALPFCINPSGPIVASLFMEEFENKAIIYTTPNPSRLWLRNVDDTFLIQRVEHNNQFMQHINSIDPHIQFIHETADPQSSIPFLDTLFSPGPDNTLLTTFYWKSTKLTSTYFGTATTVC